MTRLPIILSLALGLTAAMISPAAAEENTEVQTITIQNSSSPAALPVTVPISLQARIRNLSFEKHRNTQNGSDVLKISMHIQNMLRRRLVHAEVTVDLINSNDEIIQTITGKALPIVIEQENRYGRVEMKTDWPEDLSGAKLHLTWQGKE